MMCFQRANIGADDWQSQLHELSIVQHLVRYAVEFAELLNEGGVGQRMNGRPRRQTGRASAGEKQPRRLAGLWHDRPSELEGYERPKAVPQKSAGFAPE